MGCKSYTVNGRNIMLRSDEEDGFCLCTFPHNYEPNMDADTVRQLALLGAAVALTLHMPEPEADNEWEIVPYCLPSWIREGIDRVVLHELPECTCGIASTEHFSD